jgi:hypothetical protein
MSELLSPVWADATASSRDRLTLPRQWQTSPMSELTLGPLLRHVGEVDATVWVETDSPCTVEILGQRTGTFEVAGHHYALVCIDGLEPGSSTDYVSTVTASGQHPTPRFPRRASGPWTPTVSSASRSGPADMPARPLSRATGTRALGGVPEVLRPARGGARQCRPWAARRRGRAGAGDAVRPVRRRARCLRRRRSLSRPA